MLSTGIQLAVNPMNGGSVLGTFGALGVLVVTFAESGLLVVGFFLPGDTLLFPAGVLCAGSAASGTHLTLWQVMAGAAAGCFLGGQLSYEIGRRGGRNLLTRIRSRQLVQGVERAESLLARYGYGKAIVLGKFVPVLRSVLGPVAGMLEIPGRTYLLWQTVGAVLWTQSMVLLGFFLGSSVPAVDDYLVPLVLAVVLISALPLAGEIVRSRRERRRGGAATVPAARKPQDDASEDRKPEPPELVRSPDREPGNG